MVNLLSNFRRNLFIILLAYFSTQAKSNILLLVNSVDFEIIHSKLDFVTDFRDQFYENDSIIFILYDVNQWQFARVISSNLKYSKSIRIIPLPQLYLQIKSRYQSGFLFSFPHDTVPVRFSEKSIGKNWDRQLWLNPESILSPGTLYIQGGADKLFAFDFVDKKLFNLSKTAELIEILAPDSMRIRDVVWNGQHLIVFASKDNKSPNRIYSYKDGQWSLLIIIKNKSPELIPISAFYNRMDSTFYCKCHAFKSDKIQLCRFLNDRNSWEVVNRKRPKIDLLMMRFLDDPLELFFVSNQQDAIIYSMQGNDIICGWLIKKDSKSKFKIKAVERKVDSWNISVNSIGVNGKVFSYVMKTDIKGKPKEMVIESLEGILYHSYRADDFDIQIKYHSVQKQFSMDFYKN